VSTTAQLQVDAPTRSGGPGGAGQVGPVRSARSRAGNAMDRGRGAALRAARTVLAERGVSRLTMSLVATRAGLAKATMYNHFRDRHDLLDALLAEEIATAGAAATSLATGDLATALAWAATTMADHPAVGGLRRVEPARLVVLVGPGDGPHWAAARAQCSGVLRAAGRGGTPQDVALVLRWVTSHALSPGDDTSRWDEANRVAAAVRTAAGTTADTVASA